MKLTITEAHLDKALERCRLKRKANKSTNNACLIATVIEKEFNERAVACSFHSVKTRKHGDRWFILSGVTKLAYLFDKIINEEKDESELRSLLPFETTVSINDLTS
jgi:hypothetical protein